MNTATEAQKSKILAIIASRGWCSADLYWDAAQELRAAGIIKGDTRYSVGGHIKAVWVRA